jgi:hypothetical protein
MNKNNKMTNETRLTIEEKVADKANAVKYLANQVQEGMPADIVGVVRDLKRKGFDSYEMGRFSDDLFNATWPTIQKNIESYKQEYSSNPELAKRFSKEYKPIDFIPFFGIFPNERRAKCLRERQRFFYRWANESTVNRLKDFAFQVYHWVVPTAIMVYSFMKLGKQ